MKRVLQLALGFLVVCIANQSWAHHSGAMYDRSKTLVLEGTVKEFRFTNPHAWIRLNVVGDDGEVKVWDIESSAPGRLRKWGISPKTVPEGSKIILRTHPIRDGRRAGSLIDITLADGTVLSTVEDVNSYTDGSLGKDAENALKQ